MTVGTLALATSALFTGAALYVSVAEHPARLGLSDAAALAQWKPSYARGAVMQASLALAGSILALVAWWRDGDPLWLVGGALLFANWPVTMIMIMPVNRGLKIIDPAAPLPETRRLLVRWGKLHAIRTLLGLAATALLFAAAIG